MVGDSELPCGNELRCGKTLCVSLSENDLQMVGFEKPSGSHRFKLSRIVELWTAIVLKFKAVYVMGKHSVEGQCISIASLLHLCQFAAWLCGVFGFVACVAFIGVWL